jgi:hypothetical protein
MSIGALVSISLGLIAPPKVKKRKRGRPNKSKPVGRTLLTGLKLKRRGRPRKFVAADVLERVDEYKHEERVKGRRISDARAIGELLHRHAPPEIRRRIDSRLAFEHQSDHLETRRSRRAGSP